MHAQSNVRAESEAQDCQEVRWCGGAKGKHKKNNVSEDATTKSFYDIYVHALSLAVSCVPRSMTSTI